MAMTTVTTTTSLATTAVFALSGPCRMKADGLIAGDTVGIYEEGPGGDYTSVPRYNQNGEALGGNVELKYGVPSIIFEGYGNYKALPSRAAIVFGYDEG